MECLSSPIIEEASVKKGFPFFTKSLNTYPKPVYSLKDPNSEFETLGKPANSNGKRLWTPAQSLEEKENFPEESRPKKKVKVGKRSPNINNVNKIIEENQEAKKEDQIWRIDHTTLQRYPLVVFKPTIKTTKIVDNLQVDFSQILEELAKDKNLKEWKCVDNSALEASLQLYSSLKSQFQEKYNRKKPIPKFIVEGLAIKGEAGPDQSSFVKLLSQPSTSEKEKICETPVGKSHQVSLNQFSLNYKTRSRRPPKLVWSPAALSEEDWEAYLGEISKIVGEKITKEDAVAQHLIKFHGDFDKAIEEVKKKKMSYRSLFRVCQKNLRSRSLLP